MLGTALLFCLVSIGATDLPIVKPVDGEPFQAELSAIDATWKITFDSPTGQTTLRADDLVWWGRCREIDRGPLLVLADGSLLVADPLEADKQTLVADSRLFGLIRLPLTQVAAVIFKLPAAEHARDLLLAGEQPTAENSDRVILADGDEISGRFEQLRDDRVRLETVVGPVDVDVRRARRLVFNPALVRHETKPGLAAWVGFTDGTRLLVDRAVLQSDRLEVGPTLDRTWTADSDKLTWLQPIGGRTVYLSDLAAADYRHMPFLDLAWPYRNDANVSGGALRVAGRLHPKGIGMHSTARLTYLLDEPFKKFQAELAVDDVTIGRGSVRFRLFVDGRQAFASETIRGGTAPVPISVNLDAAKRLDLVVDFADSADELDRANWLNARLIR